MLSQGNYKLKCIKGEALASVSSAASIFANCPSGTKRILLTIRAAGLTVTFDGTTPTANAVGQDFGINAATTPYVFGDGDEFVAKEAKKVKAIEQAATATGYITYWG